MQRLAPDSSLKLLINVGSEEDAKIKLALLRKLENNWFFPGWEANGRHALLLTSALAVINGGGEGGGAGGGGEQT